MTSLKKSAPSVEAAAINQQATTSSQAESASTRCAPAAIAAPATAPEAPEALFRES